MTARYMTDSLDTSLVQSHRDGAILVVEAADIAIGIDCNQQSSNSICVRLKSTNGGITLNQAVRPSLRTCRETACKKLQLLRLASGNHTP